MNTPYGYQNVIANSMSQMSNGPNQPGGLSGPPNTLTMNAMMPPPPPPPYQGMQANNSGMMAPVSTAMQHGVGPHGNMLGPMIGGLQPPPPPPPPINPATNDAPLDFNVSRNQGLSPLGMSQGNNMSSNMDISSTGGDDGIIICSKDEMENSKESRRERGRDRDRQRQGRNRDRTNNRGGRERDRGESERSRSRRDETRNTDQHPDISPQLSGNSENGQTQMQYMGQNITGNNMNGGNPWPMWNTMATPMGGTMTGPIGPMGPVAGPMTPMGPIGPMAGPVGPTGEAKPISGEFRITWGMFGWMLSPEGLTVPVKHPMQCKDVSLVPPNRMAPPPTTRERPMGCRTIFVGGLPENITEEMVVDVFERCGEITTVRLSKKNFAHIRYELEEFVENAIFLSGYRMRISSSTDAPNTGRLHVDYAQARDDLYEWECRQRALQREQRHRERIEQERLRPPSPPPVPHYTEHEAAIVAEKLKGDEHSLIGEDVFSKAAATLVTWLERGDCSKRNTGVFYSMIQSTNSQVRRILSEKMQAQEELAKFKEQTKARLLGIMSQFGQIERVFAASSQQKVWDHFTKAQRRNIDMWKKQAQDIKQMQLDDSDKEDADEMDVSDDEAPPKIFAKSSKKIANEALKEENDSLRCQLEAYKNEVDMVKIDLRSDIQGRDEQINTYKQTLQGMQQALSENVARKLKDEAKFNNLQTKFKKLQESLRKIRKDKEDKATDSDAAKEDDEYKELIYEGDAEEIDDSESVSKLEDDREADAVSCHSKATIFNLEEKSAWLIGLTSTFLHIHPKGASVDYIWSYIQQFDKEIRPVDVENLLEQFPSVYKQTTTGVGACLERKWVFTGFDTDK